MPDLRGGGGAVVHEARADIGGFKKFLLRGNVVDLAVGVVIGAAFGNVVQAIVKDVLNPIISSLGGTGDVSGLYVTAGRITFPIGDLINALISFLLIAVIVYLFVVLPINKLMDHYKPAPQPAPTKGLPRAPTRFPRRRDAGVLGAAAATLRRSGGGNAAGCGAVRRGHRRPRREGARSAPTGE